MYDGRLAVNVIGGKITVVRRHNPVCRATNDGQMMLIDTYGGAKIN